MKYYLIAGERSGDLHGGNLIRCLKEKDKEGQFRGFGGDAMHHAGMDLVTHYRDMDFAGIVGLVNHLFTIYIKLKQCKQDILAYAPHVVVLIDYGGFNMKIAAFCKKRRIKVFYYISPKVWAWGRSRVHKLKAHVDRMFCILPFEKKFYQEFGWEVDYIGNPVLDAVKQFQPDSGFLHQYNIDTGHPLIALLPGSRKSELKKIIPLFIELVASHPQYQFAVAAVRSMPSEMYAPFLDCPNVKLIMEATYDLLFHAHAAVVTSGTATLETGLFQVPQMTLYKAKKIEYMVVIRLINVKYVSLINLIADRPVIKEYIQKDAHVENLSKELKEIVENTEYRKAMQDNYRRIYQILDTGSASENTATLMVNYLKT